MAAKKTESRQLIHLAFIGLISAFIAQNAFAGCGGSSGGNPLAQIPNLAPPGQVTVPATTPPATPATVTPSTDTTPTSSTTAVSAPKAPEPIPAGKVVWTKGTLKAIAPDKSVRELKNDDVVYQNEVIVTEKGSQAQVVFSDHTMMTFRENTKMYIKKYEYDPSIKQGSVGKSTMDLIEGGFRTITGKIAKGNPADYQVNTEVATIGVRGTDYSANIQACKLEMKRTEGTPVVQNEQGTLVLSGDQPYAAVEFNKAPVVLKSEPQVFVREPLNIILVKPFVPPTAAAPVKIRSDDDTAKITNLLDSNDRGGPGSGGSGGGGNCAIPVSTGNFNVKFR